MNYIGPQVVQFARSAQSYASMWSYYFLLSCSACPPFSLLFFPLHLLIYVPFIFTSSSFLISINFVRWTYLGHENRWDETYLSQIGLEDLTKDKFAKIGNTIRPIGESVGGLTSQVDLSPLFLSFADLLCLPHSPLLYYFFYSIIIFICFFLVSSFSSLIRRQPVS